MPLLTGASPHDVEWSRTIHMTMPASPELTPSSECSLMSVAHSVVVVVKVRAANQKDCQAEEVKLTIAIKVVVHSARPEQLPEYSGLEDVVVSEKELDQELGLPSYST
ncbi:hypothetical protein BGZ52_001128 [Haplosporangium bisporale]|nr:hypothetical protein BGZ52_001128 [Haplosporangium bisporale]KFH63824.1 hypothetical protein MVEG_10517 [Podila verticillata NRRL 6337]